MREKYARNYSIVVPNSSGYREPRGTSETRRYVTMRFSESIKREISDLKIFLINFAGLKSGGGPSDSWQESVNRQYATIGQILGFIIAAIAIVTAPVIKGEVVVPGVDVVLLGLVALLSTLSVLFLIILTHLHRLTDWFRSDRELQALENGFRLNLCFLLLPFILSLTLLLMLRGVNGVWVRNTKLCDPN